MKQFASIFCLLAALLTGCATKVEVSLPLREGPIVVPRFSRFFATAGARARVDTDNYVEGFRNGWNGELRVFAENIDHQHSFMEDVGNGDESYLDGWFDGHREAEAFVLQMIASGGKVATRAKLRAALKL